MQRHRQPPPELTEDLLVRPRLSALLTQRWDRRAVLLVAGAGFGKSTLLAQALEENRLAPRGRDHWFSCDPSDAVASTIASGFAAALGAELPPAADPRRWVLARLREAPVGTCLVVDDVQHVPEDSDGFAFLSSVVRHLPAQCHLVLAARHHPDLPLTRWRSQGVLVDIGEDDLRFTHEESAALARRARLEPSALAGTSGWPALTALACRSEGQHAGRYMWEEVLAVAPPDLRRQLAVLTAVGGGDEDLLRAAAGAPVDRAGLVALPMVRANPDGVIVAHHLWDDAVADVLSTEERARALRRAGQVLAGRGNHDPAIENLAAAGDWDGVCDVICDAAWAGYLGPPADVLAKWWSLLPTDRRDHPAALLLESTMLRARDPFDTRATELAARAREGFADRGIVGAEVAATAELTYLLRSQGDYDTIATLVSRLFELDANGAPEAAGFVRVAKAMIAEHLDDDEMLLAELDAIPPGAFEHEWQALIEWLRTNSLLMLGRPDEAVAAAHRCVELAGPTYLGGRYAVILSRWWQHIDAEVVADLPRVGADPGDLTTVDRLMTGALSGALLAFAGRRDDAEANLAEARSAAVGARPALLGVVALAEAVLAASRGSDAAAATAISSFLDEFPPDSPAARRAMRRFPGVAYALHPGARAAIETMTLGPALAGAVAAARALVALRDGAARSEPPPDPQDVLHGLPLAWATELAARLPDHAAASSLVVALVEAYGAPVRDALRVLEEETDPSGASAAEGARRLLSAVPVAPEHPPEIRLLGPVDVAVEGNPLDVPELRRSRVRQLLALVALKGPVPREVAAATLWPDAGERAASANLRTNLAHLQRALEPDRRAGEAPFLLQADGDLLVLVGHPWLTVDVEVFDTRVRDADAAAALGDHRSALELLESAILLCRGEPLSDLRWEDWASSVAERLRIAATAAFVRAAELRHALDDHTTATNWAHGAIELDPWNEAAHRVLVATHLSQGDRDAARATMEQAKRALAELGAEPEPATVMLARRAGAPFAPG